MKNIGVVSLQRPKPYTRPDSSILLHFVKFNMDESFGGGFNASHMGKGAVAAESKPEGIMPLLIKQINNADENNLSLFDIKYSLLCAVAIVRNIDYSSTKVSYTLEDHTGRVDGHLWLDEGDASKSPNVLLNSYARVYGSIRSHGGVKSLIIFKMQALESINELTTHLLEVLMARYKAEDMSNKNTHTFDTHTIKEPEKTTTSLQGNQLMIFEAINTCTDDAGISLQTLQQRFKQLTTQEIFDITEFLINEGYAFTSIDSEHFMATGNVA